MQNGWTEEQVGNAVAAIYTRARGHSQLALVQFLDSHAAAAGGTLVVRAVWAGGRRDIPEIAFASERWSGLVVPEQRTADRQLRP
jgi:hypothetical protein